MHDSSHVSGMSRESRVLVFEKTFDRTFSSFSLEESFFAHAFSICRSLNERKKRGNSSNRRRKKRKTEIIIVLIFFQNFLEILEINRGMEKNIGIIKRGKYRSSKIICQQIEIFAVGLKQIPFN